MRYLVCLSVSFIVACSGPQEAYWADEFEGSELSSELWNFDLGDGCPEICGWGNEEEQVYTRSNHRLKDGYLIITARKSDSAYTSTRITTQGKMDFQYGRLEARAKIPTGKGVWPAIWMLGSNIDEVGWPRCGEIDVLEYVGKEPGRIFTTLHTSDSYGNSVNTKKTGIPDIEEGFHIYAMEWDPEKIRFFVDGELLYTFAPEERTEEIWPFDQPFYLILNLAIGGKFGGPEIDDSIFPQEFIIDYVRVFKQG